MPTAPGIDQHHRTTSTHSRALPYIGALDGLRGVAVIAVVLFHSGVALPGGFLGVSTFFTLSGFLITSLLLADHERGTGIALRQFWIRRVRRLLPAALLALALCAVFTWLFGDASQRAAFRADGLAALGYAANWRFVFSGESYASTFAAPSPVLHFWSLAIEEQFYLFFPLLAAAVLRVGGASKRVFAAVLGALFLASAALPHLLDGSHDRLYFGTDTRAAELLAGALLAVGLSARGNPLDAIDRTWTRRRRITMAIVGAVALEAMVVAWLSTTEASAWVYAGGLSGYSLLTVIVIVAALANGSPVQRLLSLAPLRALGRVSYGVYLFHWPVLLWLSPQRTGWSPVVRLVVASAITLALAALSYTFLEQPIRSGTLRWRPIDASDPFARLRRPPSRVGRLAPIAITAVACLIVLSAAPPAGEHGINLDVASGTLISDVDLDAPIGPMDTTAPVPQATRSSDAKPTKAPAQPSAELASTRPEPLTPKPLRVPSRPLRVLVVGDSTALFLDPPLNEWGGETRVWGASNHARIGCGFGRGGQRRHRNDVEWIPQECGNWASEWPIVLRAAKPDLIIVADGFWDATDRLLLGDDTWRAPGDPAYDEYLRGEFTNVVDVLSSSGAVVAWLDNPSIQLGAGEASNFTGYSVNEPARMMRTNEILHEVAATRPLMRVIPYRSFYEAWPGGMMDPELRPDAVHVDEHGGAIVARWLGPEVLDAYWTVRDPASTDR